MSSGIVSKAFDSVLYYLSPSQKTKAIWFFVLLLISSFLEVFGLAALIPIMLVASKPEGVKKIKYFSYVYNTLGFESEKAFLLFLIIMIFLFFLLKNAFTIWVTYLQSVFTAEIGLEIIESQLVKHMNLPFWNFNDAGSSNLINATLQIPSTYVNGILRPLFVLASEVVVIVIVLMGIFLYKPILLLALCIILVPTTTLLYRSLRVRSQNIGDKINLLRPISFSILSDLFVGYVELKLANKQERFRRNLVVNQAEVQKLDAQGYLYSLLPIKVIEMVAILGVLTIFLYALYFGGGKNNIIELVGLFAAAAYRLMPSVNRILQSLFQMKQAEYTIENMESAREPWYDTSPDLVQYPVFFEKELHIKNMSFTFPKETNKVINGIDIKIEKGEKIGFIGSSGSGKTTLMNILLRFYVEQDGNILVDDKPLNSQNILAWHQLIGYVKQDTFLMESSIKDNITLGDEEVDEIRLEYAIEQASLMDFVKKLPAGVNTHIGERGSKLSGGQRQRIGIARALYKRTEILVLDEATSALDNETEREVNEAINKLAHTDITILIIAHRITTLRECDRIYELNQGKVVAVHQYKDLMRHTTQK